MNKKVEDIDFSNMDFNSPEMKKHQEIIRKDMEDLKKNKKLYKKVSKINLDDSLNESNNNLFWIFCVSVSLIILITLFSFVYWDNTNTHKANDKLKKENYELKQKVNKLENEKLNLLLGNN